MKTLDISGFGGPKHPYEMCCQRMLMRGLRYLKTSGFKLPEKFSLFSEEPELKKFFDAVCGDDGPTGAQMGAVVSHICFIVHNGQEKWLAVGSEGKDSRIFDNGEDL